MKLSKPWNRWLAGALMFGGAVTAIVVFNPASEAPAPVDFSERDNAPDGMHDVPHGQRFTNGMTVWWTEGVTGPCQVAVLEKRTEGGPWWNTRRVLTVPAGAAPPFCGDELGIVEIKLKSN